MSLERELGDVEFAISLLTDSNDLLGEAITKRAIEKAKKIKPWLHHQ